MRTDEAGEKQIACWLLKIKLWCGYEDAECYRELRKDQKLTALTVQTHVQTPHALLQRSGVGICGTVAHASRVPEKEGMKTVLHKRRSRQPSQQ